MTPAMGIPQSPRVRFKGWRGGRLDRRNRVLGGPFPHCGGSATCKSAAVAIPGLGTLSGLGTVSLVNR
jgi:hypothetical protein